MVESLNVYDISKAHQKNISAAVEEIRRLEDSVEKTRQMSSVHSRLRLRNQIVSIIGVKFIQYPQLINHFKAPYSAAVLCGICRKIQRAPETGDIEFLQEAANSSHGNFTKGNIVNAIAEIIYSHQLQLNDDKRIHSILNILKVEADKPLEKNIERVEAALEFLMDS